MIVEEGQKYVVVQRLVTGSHEFPEGTVMTCVQDRPGALPGFKDAENHHVLMTRSGVDLQLRLLDGDGSWEEFVESIR